MRTVVGDPSSDVVVIIGIITAVVVIASIVYVVFSAAVGARNNSNNDNGSGAAAGKEEEDDDEQERREGFFASSGEGYGQHDDIDVDELNEYRGIVREAFAVVLDRYPTKEEQSTYIRLLSSDQTSFVGIMKALKRSDEYVRTKTNRIVDPLPPPTKSIVEAEEDREASQGGDVEVLRAAFRDQMKREAREEELSCMLDRVRSGRGASTGEAIIECAGYTRSDRLRSSDDDNNDDSDDEDGTASSRGRSEDDEEKERRGDEYGHDTDDDDGDDDDRDDEYGDDGDGGGEVRPDNDDLLSASLSDLDASLESIEGEERREMEDTVRRVYAKVHGRDGHATAAAPQGDKWAPPAELNRQTLDMWIMYLWKDDKDAAKLERRMRALQRASRGVPIGGSGGEEEEDAGPEARVPAGMDADPYALAYALDADMLGDDLSEEERARRKRAYAKQRNESYGVGTRYGGAETAEEALIMRSRKMDAADLAAKREEDRKRFLRRR